MDIRLIAFDLDGTLLRSDKSISPRTMQALLAARERGVLLVPSTGRLLRSLPEPLLDKSLTRYHILVNGAQVYDSFEDKTLLREELTPQQAMCMLHFLKSRNVLRGVYIDGLGHMSREDFSEIEAVAATPAALMRRSYQTDEDLDAVTAQHDSVQKIIAFFRNPDDKQATIREITARFPGYAVSSSLGNNIEKKRHKGQRPVLFVRKNRCAHRAVHGLRRRHKRLFDAPRGRLRRGDGERVRGSSVLRRRGDGNKRGRRGCAHD